MSEAALRPATPAHADAVARIWREGWRDGHLGHVPAALVEVRTPESFSQRAADRVADTTVAVVDGEVAGSRWWWAMKWNRFLMCRGHTADSGIATQLLDNAVRTIGDAGHAVAWLAVATGNDRASTVLSAVGVDRRGSVPLRGVNRFGQHTGALPPVHRPHSAFVALTLGDLRGHSVRAEASLHARDELRGQPGSRRHQPHGQRCDIDLAAVLLDRGDDCVGDLVG